MNPKLNELRSEVDQDGLRRLSGLPVIKSDPAKILTEILSAKLKCSDGFDVVPVSHIKEVFKKYSS